MGILNRQAPTKGAASETDPMNTSPVDLAKRVIAESIAAVAADQEIRTLAERRPIVLERLAEAQAQLARVGRERAEARSATLRAQSVAEEAQRLVRGEAPPTVIPLDDAAVQRARHTVEVAEEAVRQIDTEIRNRSLVIQRDTAHRLWRDLEQAELRAIALETARLHGRYGRIFDARELLVGAGFGAAALGQPTWPTMIFETPAQAYSPGAMFEREAVKTGLMTREEHAEALGAFIGREVVAGIVSPNLPAAEALENRPKPDNAPRRGMWRIDRFGKSTFIPENDAAA